MVWGEKQSEVRQLGETLTRLGFQARVTETMADVLDATWEHRADLIIARLSGCFPLPLQLLDSLEEFPSAPPVLIVTSGADVHLYLEAMRRGAFDCVGLPLQENELIRIVTRALETRQTVAVGGGQ